MRSVITPAFVQSALQNGGTRMYFFGDILRMVFDEVYKFRLAFLLCLGTLLFSFLAIILHIEIPWINLLLFLSCSSFIMLAIISMTSIRLKYRLFWCIAMALLATGCWILFSYQSYYQGVRVTKSTEAQILYSAVKDILETDVTDDKKLQQLHELTAKSKASIIITKNGENYYFQPHGRNTEQYIIEKISDEERQKNKSNSKAPEWGDEHYLPFETLQIQGNKYDFSYEYANKPYLEIGLARAITWSVFPDILYPKQDFHHFIALRLYERSMNFWVPYLLLFISGMLVSFTTTKLKESELAVKRINNKLENFQHAYEKIQRDFSGVVSNSKNNLQHLQSEWDKDFKAAAGLGRHDVLNRIKALRSDTSLLDDQDMEKRRKEQLAVFKQALVSGAENEATILQDTYDFILDPWIKKIHKELKGLENTLDMTIIKTSVQNVLKAIRAGEPLDITQQKTSIHFTETISPHLRQDAYCKVILSKVQSIVFNLISNSAAATESRLDHFIEEGDRDQIRNYTQTIELQVDEITKEAATYLCITISDNGGGFPEDILHKIYKEPIRTTKDNREYGQGTSYIGFFIDLMQGARIEAHNIVNTKGEAGASTVVYIPYI